MKKYTVEIELLSPLHLGSGHQDVIVDAEVIRDRWGMPCFPGKRLKGLLYESALEMAEISQEKWFTVADVKNLFAQKQENKKRLKRPLWAFLQKKKQLNLFRSLAVKRF